MQKTLKNKHKCNSVLKKTLWLSHAFNLKLCIMQYSPSVFLNPLFVIFHISLDWRYFSNGWKIVLYICKNVSHNITNFPLFTSSESRSKGSPNKLLTKSWKRFCIISSTGCGNDKEMPSLGLFNISEVWTTRCSSNFDDFNSVFSSLLSMWTIKLSGSKSYCPLRSAVQNSILFVATAFTSIKCTL